MGGYALSNILGNIDVSYRDFEGIRLKTKQQQLNA